MQEKASSSSDLQCGHQDAAVEKLLELTQNKTGSVTTRVLLQMLSEAGEVLVDDAVEHLLLRVATDMWQGALCLMSSHMGGTVASVVLFRSER